MKTLVNVLIVIISFLALGTFVVGGYSTVVWIAGLLSRLDFDIATITAIAALVVLLAAGVIASSIRRASWRRAAQRIHTERLATYQLLADVWGAVVAGAEADAEDLSATRRVLDRLMALYAGVGTLKAHVALQALERERGAGDPAVRLQLARTLLEMRRDLGLEMRGLAAEKLQALFDVELRRPLALNTDAPAAPHFVQPIVFEDLRPRVSLTPDA